VELGAQDDGHGGEVVEQQEGDGGGQRAVGEAVGVDVCQVQAQPEAGEQEHGGGEQRSG